MTPTLHIKPDTTKAGSPDPHDGVWVHNTKHGSDGRPVDLPMVLHARVVTGSGGGPDKTIFRSANAIDHSRFRIGAAYIRPYDNPGMAVLRAQAERWCCPLWEVPEWGPVDPRTLRRLLWLCRALNVKVWHAHDHKSDFLGLLLRRRWPMKLVTTVHGWTRDTIRARLYKHIDTWCLKGYDHVIAVSPQLQEHCLAHGVAEHRLTHIPNAIEPSEFTRELSAAAAREELGIRQDRLVVMTVGRLSIEKGPDRAIRAIAHVRQTYPEAELHLIGDGPERERLEDLTHSLGLADAVHFWGWQTQPQRFYEAADALLLPSRTEGLPNVVLEAMAMGVPVAATDVGGVSELLAHGRCGVILSQDEQTWANRIAYLLESSARRALLARLARARIESRYTFRQRMERVQKVYRKVLGLEQETHTQTTPLRKAA